MTYFSNFIWQMRIQRPQQRSDLLQVIQSESVKTKTQLFCLVARDLHLQRVYRREGTDPISSPKRWTKCALWSAELTSPWDFQQSPCTGLHSEGTVVSWTSWCRSCPAFFSYGFLCINNNLHGKFHRTNKQRVETSLLQAQEFKGQIPSGLQWLCQKRKQSQDIF